MKKYLVNKLYGKFVQTYGKNDGINLIKHLFYRGLLNKLANNDSVVKANVHGINMYMSAKHLLPTYIKIFPLQEKVITRICDSTGSLDYTFIDVGANIGDTILIALAAKHKPTKVVALEPSIFFFRLLEKNIEECEKSIQIIKENCYMSDKLNEQSYELIEECGTAQLVKTSLPNSINTKTLDQIIESNNIKNFKLIKIDVDGFDFKVLRGLSAHNLVNCIIFIEIAPNQLLKNNEDPNWIIDKFFQKYCCNYILYDNAGYIVSFGDSSSVEHVKQLFDYSKISERLHFDLLLFIKGTEDLYKKFKIIEDAFFQEYKQE